MIDRSDIDKLKALPIESVAERLGLRVAHHRSLCPFHDDSHPSLTFNLRRNRFKCYVCDAHGGVIDLVEKVLGVDFKDACRWLGSDTWETPSPVDTHPSPDSFTSHPTPFTPEKYARYFERPFINAAAGSFLFEKRHLDPRVVRWCRLSSWKNWLQIPYFDMDGHLIGVQWRNLEYRSHPSGGDSEGAPRFRFPYGSQCHIYNLPILKLLRPGEDLYITEGCSDCWAMLSSGHKAIAIPSATLLKPQDLEILSSFTAHPSPITLHMYPDQDLPGERLFLHLKEFLETPSPFIPHPSPLIRHQLPPGCKDYSDYYLSCTDRSQSVNVNR